jgi:hypothetical protein
MHSHSIVAAENGIAVAALATRERGRIRSRAKPVQLVAYMRESKAKEEEEVASLEELLLSS